MSTKEKGLPRGRSGNKKRVGRPPVKRTCDLCLKECLPEAFCFGCRCNVCKSCDKHPSLRNTHRGMPTTPHRAPDHKVEHFHEVYGSGGDDGDVAF